jgi:type I restriction enzyme S subunit
MEKLLDGVAVEWIEVGELISPQRGRRLVKNQLEEVGSYAVYQNSMKPLGYYHESNAQAGATFVIVAGAAGEIGFSDVAFWAADDVYFFPESNTVHNKYLYHFLLTKQHEISSQVRRASIPRLSIAAVEKLEIPIPCPDNPKKSLEIQAEIVRILDAFTSLTAELTAELTARKKQYNHYRDQLLSFEDGDVEWTVLGDERFVEVANYARRPVKASLRVPGETPYYGANNIQDYVDGYTHDGEYVLIAEDGSASLGNYSVQYATGKFWANNHVHVVRGKQGLNTRFLYHYLRIVDFIPYLPNKDRSKLTKGEMIKIPLAIPCPEDPEKSLEIQAGLVRVLDKFDALTDSLTEGLPREIALRQKQYEYYRDLLLSFPKPEEVAA